MDCNPRKIRIEKIKSVLLVVLFLSTILLLCFFWGDMSFKDFSLETLGIYDENSGGGGVLTEELIVPSKIKICFGDEIYSMSTENKRAYWGNKDSDGILSTIKTVMDTDGAFLEEITKEQYEKTMSYPSIRATFDYFVPFDEFCAFEGFKTLQNSNKIKAMTEVGFSDASLESMFIYDESNKKYYRIVTVNKIKNLFEYCNEIAVSENTTYYSLETYFGQEGDNEVWIPLYLETQIVDIPVSQDFTVQKKDRIEEMAKSFFSNSFDFIRKIEEESGKCVYMYGYGQKLLIADVDGTLEYKAESDGGNAELQYFEALDIAVDFIDKNDGFVTDSNQKLSPYIEKVEYDFDKKNGYRFEFGILCNNRDVLYQTGNPLVVEVTNGQVTYYKRSFISFDENYNKGNVNIAHSAVNVIAQNYQYIYNVLNNEKLLDYENEEKDPFNYVVRNITDMDYGYVRLDNEYVIQGCFVVDLQNGAVQVYFDIDNAKPLGYSVR